SHSGITSIIQLFTVVKQRQKDNLAKHKNAKLPFFSSRSRALKTKKYSQFDWLAKTSPISTRNTDSSF
ncbi:hypothetical protein, partial [Oscillatoria salina]|uniref:hypothetical protein n=1 Tax=Oscillatoria salina TaxID=331517 RepID=UPI001CCCAA29